MKNLTFLVLFFLASCTSTNKHKTLSVSKVDSVAHSKVDSSTLKKKSTVQVKRNNTVKKVQADKTYEKKTVIEFEPLSNNAADYTWNDTVKQKPYKHVPNRIKSITIFEKGTDKTKTITKNDIKDSTVHSDQQQATITRQSDTELHKTEKVKDKAVKRFSFNWWWLLLLIPAYIIYRYWPVIKAFFLRFGI